VTPDDLLAVFDIAAAAQRGALATLGAGERRARTDRAGQYRLDLVADAAVLPVLHSAGLRVLSEESGWTGPADADVTVVLDPVDGSTNCARGVPYWAELDREAITPASTTDVARAVVALSGWPPTPLAWRQFRALGSAALALCDVAAGHLDGYVDGQPDQHAPWDYLGALLVCDEAGALVADADGRDLVTLDADARRQLIAAGTKELFEQLHGAAGP
jgi:myo-inositol-1(or 4)-monophosphatase